ncbi:MAG: DoxX family membrane protein [Breznakibacter sp.]
MKEFNATFFFMRLPVALSLLGHGLVRLPKLAAFSEWMVGTMGHSVLPAGLVQVWAYVLPLVETLLGLLLLLGVKPKCSIYAALSLMGILILGSSSIENWSAIEAQLIHAFYLSGLLWFVEKNGQSGDKQQAS